MSKRLSNVEKIAKIESDHKRLLSIVKDSIVENKDNLIGEMDKIMLALSADESQVKQYKAVVKAKDLIEQLVEQILNANSVEDVLKIRNRINYYINKVKKEIMNRNLSQDMIDNYQEKTASLRKNIAKVIRVLKREEKIEHINNCLSSGEMQDNNSLQKMLKNEQRFNNYYFNPSKKATNGKKKVVSRKPAVEALDLTDGNSESMVDGVFNEGHDNRFVLSQEFSLPVETSNNKPVSQDDSLESFFANLPSKSDSIDKSSGDGDIFDFIDNIQSTFSSKPVNTSTSGIYESDEDYLKKMARRLNLQYGLAQLDEYDSSRVKNIGRFFSNLPAHIHNKRIINKMMYDSQTFYTGSDLRSFISYTRRRNSIQHALKCIFSKSYLNLTEVECLNNHERCAEWLEQYCNKRHLDSYYIRRVRI